MNGWTRTVATLLVVLSLGLHWAVLQSVAWAGMFARFARTDSAVVALAKTFDGRHPCALCRLVRHGTQPAKEDQQPRTTAPSRLEGCWLPAGFAMQAPMVLAEPDRKPLPLPSISLPPPTPPPRAG